MMREEVVLAMVTKIMKETVKENEATHHLDAPIAILPSEFPMLCVHAAALLHALLTD